MKRIEDRLADYKGREKFSQRIEVSKQRKDSGVECCEEEEEMMEKQERVNGINTGGRAGNRVKLHQ